MTASVPRSIRASVASSWTSPTATLDRRQQLQVPGPRRAAGGDADPAAGAATAPDEHFGDALADEARAAEDQEIAMHDEGAWGRGAVGERRFSPTPATPPAAGCSVCQGSSTGPRAAFLVGRRRVRVGRADRPAEARADRRALAAERHRVVGGVGQHLLDVVARLVEGHVLGPDRGLHHRPVAPAARPARAGVVGGGGQRHRAVEVVEHQLEVAVPIVMLVSRSLIWSGEAGQADLAAPSSGRWPASPASGRRRRRPSARP